MVFTIGDVLNQWQEVGVFAFVLPFLIVFAIVFGILSTTKVLGKNKGVQATIALAVGLLSLQFGYVTEFYATIFPYAGIGLAILLVGLIFTGLLLEDDSGKKWIRMVYFILGAIIFFYVVFGSLSGNKWFGGLDYGFQESWPTVIVGLILAGILALIMFGEGKPGKPKGP